jgi:hypothetical protein
LISVDGPLVRASGLSPLATLLLLLLAGTAVSHCGRGESTAHRGPDADSAVQARTATLVSQLKSLVGTASSVDDVAARAGSYVTSLPNADTRLLANALSAENEPPYDLYGASILVSLGDEPAASRVFARFVRNGGDMTGFFWSWIHGADSDTAARMYIGIAEILLPELDTLTPSERERAQRFLTTDGLGPNIPAFSERAVRDRLESLKAERRGSAPRR